MAKGNICSGSLRQLSFLTVSLLTHDARVIQHGQGRPPFHMMLELFNMVKDVPHFKVFFLGSNFLLDKANMWY